ncbi:MAG: YveK family protein [Coriobacteriales bacterium]|jgi:capsular polysaccharide biosynthesis protein
MTLLELFKLLRKHLKVVIAIPVIFTLIAAVICIAFLPDEYTSNVSIYVLLKSDSSSSQSVSDTDLTASQMITNDVATLIESDRVKDDAAEALNLDNLDDFDISVESSSNTRIITVSVTGDDPDSVALVASQIATTTDKIARNVMDVKAINVIDQASVPTEPSGPNRILYTVLAFLLGLFVAIAAVVIADVSNTRVRSAEEASELLNGLPIIGRIPRARI